MAETSDWPAASAVRGRAGGLLPQVVQSIAAGQYGVGRLWTALGAAAVPVGNPAKFHNVNTPEDLNP